jgi:hypothetical protein
MSKDIIVFGATAGIIGNTVKTIISLIFYYMGYLEKTYIHISSGYFVTLSQLEKPITLINGLFSDFIYAGFLGILIYIILINTNTNFIILKGIFFGGFIHVVNNGVLLFCTMNEITMIDPLNYLLLFISCTFYGLVTCLLIKKYI